MNQRGKIGLMIKKIDTFYVVDYDRCIGNIEGSFDILKEIVHELGIVDGHIFQLMREQTESNGGTFSPFEYIKNHHPSVDLDDVEKLYAKKAKLESYNLLEPGAIGFITFLKNTGREFCIMSFGDKRWQTTKVRNSGIGDVPTVIVPKSQKGKYIRKWLSPNTGMFQIPGEYFFDMLSKEVREVVLVDDKITAFASLPKGARGYYVSGSSSKHANANTTRLPASVKKVSHVDEIITFESNHSID
jgi:FMN phosphatase YigB (HAD superfamily)